MTQSPSYLELGVEVTENGVLVTRHAGIPGYEGTKYVFTNATDFATWMREYYEEMLSQPSREEAFVLKTTPQGMDIVRHDDFPEDSSRLYGENT